MKLFTIGFTKKSAEEFFTRLQKAGVRRVVDIRLNNTSQIAGFAKSNDLQYFLKAIAGIEYIHLTDFAPSQEILDDFKEKKDFWNEYESKFNELMIKRQIDKIIPEVVHDGDCLLCSEPTPEQCHRRLVAEHIKKNLANIEVEHL